MRFANAKYSTDAILLGVLITLSFFLPRLFAGVKLPFLVAITVYGVYFLIKNNFELFNLSKQTTWFIFLYLIYSGFSSYLGFVRDNPCTGAFFRLNFIFFILLYISSFIMTSKNKFNVILWTCHIVSIAISIYTFFFFLHSIGVLKIPAFLLFSDLEGAKIHDGYVHITNSNMSMQIFLFPFILLLSLSKEIVYNKRLSLVNSIAIIMAFSTMLLCGRRAIWIVLVLSLLVFFFQIARRLGANHKIFFRAFVFFLVLCGITTFLIYEYDINVNGISQRFLDAFSSKDAYNRSNLRLQQKEALFNGFLKFPVFGSGAGIGVSDCVRSASGCSYELSYNFILYNSGISGFIIYFAALSQIVWGLLTQKTQLGNSLALAFICGLIANATNPYFSSSFDFLWWAFIPLFYLKACENEKSFFSVKK